VLRYACALCDSSRVEMRHVAPDVAVLLEPEIVGNRTLASMPPQRNTHDSHGLHDSRDERTRIVEALTRHQWRPNAAAQALGISRATLYRRIAKLEIVGPHRS
jgi:transcriptional regulator of acetoin/glycerol metabolism